MLDELKVRHGRNEIYTYVGEILVSVNPYQWIDGLYSDAQERRYSNIGDKSSVSPHIFAVSDVAFAVRRPHLVPWAAGGLRAGVPRLRSRATPRASPRATARATARATSQGPAPLAPIPFRVPRLDREPHFEPTPAPMPLPPPPPPSYPASATVSATTPTLYAIALKT